MAHSRRADKRSAIRQLSCGDADAYRALGDRFDGLKRPLDALAAYLAALRLRPDDAGTCFSLGNVLADLGRFDEAVAAYGIVIRLAPDSAEAHTNLGNVLRRLQRPDEAAAAYRTAIQLGPDGVEAYNNLATVLRSQRRCEEALRTLDAALRLKPDYAAAHGNRGNALKELGRFEDAVAAYATALRLQPDLAAVHSNLGSVLTSLGRLEDAHAAFATALRLAPDYAEAHFNRALLHLLSGDYAEGWRGYEWRWRRDLPDAKPPVAGPQWRGEDIAGRTILLHAEQGLGDTLQFCRYVPMVAVRGARVVLQVPPPLVRLLADLPCEIVATGAALPPFDLHCPLMSLPLAFGTTLETIPADIPYLAVDRAAVARWRERLGASGRLRVGIAWSGNPQHADDRNRSLPLDVLARIAQPGLDLIGLQKDVRPDDACVLAVRPDIRNFATELSDLAETASLVAALDLVVSVDTSVAHLAGALGKPVWVLLPVAPDWRWLLGRDDSPWYPTARLFRQDRAGDWDGAIRRVMVSLGDALAESKPT